MEGIKCVLLDIEGTICPISFVKDTLFPYALQCLPAVLATEWDDPAFRPYRDAFPAETRSSPATLEAHVRDLTARDAKVASLKGLQGHLWETGYRTGAYATPLFPDVVPRLHAWSAARVRLAVYSSGSVFAQKLLFAHVRTAAAAGEARAGEKRAREGEEEAGESRPKRKKGEGSGEVIAGDEAGDDEGGEEGNATAATAASTGETENGEMATEDLTGLICGWFDTTNAGPKAESSSYDKIAGVLKHPPEDVLFLSDNVKEVDAAIAAGMQSFLVERPGNAPLTEPDRERLTIVRSLEEIDIVQRDGSDDNDEEETDGTDDRLEIAESASEEVAKGEE